MRAAYECDLHSHTTVSDGNDTYSQLIDCAADRGLKAVAVTDHDKPPLTVIDTPEGKLAAQEYARQRGVRLIPGIELSCDTNVEDVHIVGLCCDFGAPAFLELEREMQASKADGYRRLVQALAADGVKISWQEVVDREGEAGEAGVQKKHIFELLAQKGFAPSWSEAKIRIQTDPKYAAIKREKITPERAVEIIHRTGGLAIQAHPYLIDERTHGGVSREEYLERLIQAGIDGIEARYPYSKTSYKGGQSDEQIEREVRQRYEKRLKFLSGGSDYHNDAKKGVKNARQLGDKGLSLQEMRQNPTLNQLLL